MPGRAVRPARAVSTLSHHLARFTGLRRRHELDEGLALILRDLLHLQSVGVYRPVGDPDDLRWSACAWYGDEPSSGPALASLSPQMRAVIQACVLDGLTAKEAGVLLGVPTNTVKTRLHRAKAHLRHELAGGMA